VEFTPAGIFAEAFKRPAEVPAIACATIAETAAENFVALARRWHVCNESPELAARSRLSLLMVRLYSPTMGTRRQAPVTLKARLGTHGSHAMPMTTVPPYQAGLAVVPHGIFIRAAGQCRVGFLAGSEAVLGGRTA
jgi:hypothetical protein